MKTGKNSDQATLEAVYFGQKAAATAAVVSTRILFHDAGFNEEILPGHTMCWIFTDIPHVVYALSNFFFLIH